MSAVQEFFVPEPVWYYAGSEGFALFGAEHLLALAVCAALIGVLAWQYRAASAEGRAAQQRLMAGTAMGLLVAKDLCYIALGLFDPAFWPLHICNFCEYLALAAALAHGTRAGATCRGVLLCWASLACTGALLFPGWRYYTPALTWANVSSFAEHALVLACVVCAAAAREPGPTLSDVRNSALAALALGALARRINPLLGTNFFFVTRPASTGGPFVWLEATFGNPGFLVAYFAAACAFWLALSFAWRPLARPPRAQTPETSPK